jgi:aspartyl-tRNA(Asn)/glutamyl-tRNA(Gln) amidotransferase subunit A
MQALTIAEIGSRLRAGTLSAVGLAEQALAQIADRDGDIHAFVAVTAARALADAARADRELAAGLDRGPLHGVPYALKDMIDVAGLPTTAQSHLLRDTMAEMDSTLVVRLSAAGAVLLGKLATYEFATVGPDYGLPFPPARNPRNLAHIPGGSSSGAAAAVAAGFVRLAIGTDTGGSIRSPACYCGVVGLKPTFGLVSRHGVLPLSSSLDHVGPLAASVAEAAVALDAIAGFDPADPASLAAQPPGAAAGLGLGVAGLRIGYARGFHAAVAEPEIADALEAAAVAFAQMGAAVEEVALPDPALFEECGTVILQAEAFALHRHRLATRGAEYGRRAYQSLLGGAAITAADLTRAQQTRRQLTEMIRREVFGRFDALLVANTLTTAPPFAAFDGLEPRWTPMRTFAFNITGLPALAVPIGNARNGLPMGMQIVGKPFAEAMICRIGAAYEAARRPASRA